MKASAKFETAFDLFMEELRSKAFTFHALHFPRQELPRFVAIKGRRYWKIVEENRNNSAGRSVKAFVDMTNGNVLKAATWSAPAKQARGNIYDADHGASALTKDGYIRYLI